MTVSVGLVFVSSEEEPIYELVVSTFRELVIGNAYIEVILTNNELTLRNACSTIYPDILQLLCLWHVNKNVLSKVQE